MKEVTYEDWQKNPTPRVMWVWNDFKEEIKVKEKVVYIINDGRRASVLVVIDENRYRTYQHCAEIEKSIRMTNKELSRWLREKPTREWKYKDGNSVYSVYDYEEKYADEEICIQKILIREDYGEWREPLVEVEE